MAGNFVNTLLTSFKLLFEPFSRAKGQQDKKLSSTTASKLDHLYMRRMRGMRGVFIKTVG
ncbi:hypothetical protein [Salinimicrobium oceani]|uniref:Uncharacterized protein n=1 Tax=Salinimicrobium oceani TaxID=2722702 RepID=A0ABX1CYW8_9FLAO|nr:hypothetical protein [Salinimicrobium oceani]NJW53470.1 hypothetical protein [Salinimicrobium oceani]